MQVDQRVDFANLKYNSKPVMNLRAASPGIGHPHHRMAQDRGVNAAAAEACPDNAAVVAAQTTPGLPVTAAAVGIPVCNKGCYGSSCYREV